MKKLFLILVVFISANVFSQWPPEDKKLMYEVCVEKEINYSSYKYTTSYCNCFVDALSGSTDASYFLKNAKKEEMKTLAKKIRAYCRAENTNK